MALPRWSAAVLECLCKSWLLLPIQPPGMSPGQWEMAPGLGPLHPWGDVESVYWNMGELSPPLSCSRSFVAFQVDKCTKKQADLESCDVTFGQVGPAQLGALTQFSQSSPNSKQTVFPLLSFLFSILSLGRE